MAADQDRLLAEDILLICSSVLSLERRQTGFDFLGIALENRARRSFTHCGISLRIFASQRARKAVVSPLPMYHLQNRLFMHDFLKSA